MAQLPELSSPMVGCRAGFHPDQARRLLREERQQLAPRQPPLDDNRPASINPVAGENFTLAAGTTVTGASFDVTTPPVGYVPNSFGGPVWPVPVTVSIYADAGGQILGAQLFSETYSTFLSDIVTSSPTPNQSGSDLVSVSIPSLDLASGTYDIFLTDPVNLELPEYFGGTV